MNIYMQKNEFRLLPYTTHKNELELDPRLNLRVKTAKLLEENISMNICDLGFGYLRCNFCASKDVINKVKRQLRDWEKIFANHMIDKKHTSRIHKECLQLYNK